MPGLPHRSGPAWRVRRIVALGWHMPDIAPCARGCVCCSPAFWAAHSPQTPRFQSASHRRRPQRAMYPPPHPLRRIWPLPRAPPSIRRWPCPAHLADLLCRLKPAPYLRWTPGTYLSREQPEQRPSCCRRLSTCTACVHSLFLGPTLAAPHCSLRTTPAYLRARTPSFARTDIHRLARRPLRMAHAAVRSRVSQGQRINVLRRCSLPAPSARGAPLPPRALAPTCVGELRDKMAATQSD